VRPYFDLLDELRSNLELLTPEEGFAYTTQYFLGIFEGYEENNVKQNDEDINTKFILNLN